MMAKANDRSDGDDAIYGGGLANASSAPNAHFSALAFGACLHIHTSSTDSERRFRTSTVDSLTHRQPEHKEGTYAAFLHALVVSSLI